MNSEPYKIIYSVSKLLSNSKRRFPSYSTGKEKFLFIEIENVLHIHKIVLLEPVH